MDTLNFDGSCDKNPGGRMGFGWVLNLSGQLIKGKDEKRPHKSNTNNVAEYTALKKGLEDYVRRRGTGPLEVMGDSKLVIKQMRGEWRISNLKMQELASLINLFIDQHDLKIDYRWIPRDQNSIADGLAAPPKSASEQLPQNKYVTDVRQAPISEHLRMQIVSVNRAPSPGFKTMKNLKVGGRDTYSTKKLSDLIAEAGKEPSMMVKEQFPDDKKAQASALRWLLRGLALDHAIHKVRVDLDINAKVKRGKR
ncbi:MAG: ribonuclease HI family protein [Methanosarcinaceae archaeon]|nr:ribonuclease HI family protein [Methanosarcinaceae archaeon]